MPATPNGKTEHGKTEHGKTEHGKTEHGKTEHGKAVASRNATTHGLFARDIVLPSLGEDPQGYQQIEAEWIAQLKPQNLLERHYVEKIAAASWRLRRLHRWQAQLFEDETLTEDERLDKLDKVLRHETHLHRQIDTAVKMLNKDVPQLYKSRVRDQVLLDMMLSERECRESARDETEVDLETRGRLRRLQWATEAALGTLSQAPLDTGGDTQPRADAENCQNEPGNEPVGAPLAAPSSLPAPSSSSPFLEGGVGACPPGSQCCAGGWSAEGGISLTEKGLSADEENEDEGQNCQNQPRPRAVDNWTAADRQAFLNSLATPHPSSLPVVPAAEALRAGAGGAPLAPG